MHRVRTQVGCMDYMQDNNRRRPITVAVLDTGMSPHPDLKDNLLIFADFVKGKKEAYDDNGHGTHVCGILCGSGYASEGRYRGMAPDIKVIMCKVLDKNGDGNLDTMLKAIQWIQENREKYYIKILNISVGVGKRMNTEKEKVLRDKLEALWLDGILVVCAAGNNGPKADSLSYIGKSPYLITVGCHDGMFYKDHKDRCSLYSGRGENLSAIRKPDIVAPGTHIISCNSLCTKTKKGFRNAYCSKSGTSMATPIVSGALALLLEKHPGYNNETAKRKLLFSAMDLNEPWYQQGWGMVNVTRLLE